MLCFLAAASESVPGHIYANANTGANASSTSQRVDEEHIINTCIHLGAKRLVSLAIEA